MLLEIRFHGLRFPSASASSRSATRTPREDGRPARVARWSYRTLEGHFETGQRDYEVWKWLDTGEVEFRTHAVSRRPRNPLVQLGFRLFGRHEQVEFGSTAGSRMALLTAVELQRGGAATDGRVVDGSLLGVYLRDHHALLVALRELAGRIGSGSQRDVERSFGSRLEAAARADLSALDATLGRLELGPSRTKDASVWIGEKLARTKLNGRVASRSPLSSVTELEGSRLLLESARHLWSGLAELGLGPADARERAARATEDADEAERLRLAALADAVWPSTAAGSRAQK